MDGCGARTPDSPGRRAARSTIRRSRKSRTPSSSCWPSRCNPRRGNEHGIQRRRTAAVASVIDPRARIGAVHLTIGNLDASIRFYEAHLGFALHRRDERTAWLGAGGADLLVLSACERAPRVRGTTGLYHFAILVPTRADLARALIRLAETETVMQGAADHGVSEALYLADVDGNGIEIYRDRPRDRWPMSGGRLQMVSDPLDLDDLLAELATGESGGVA